MRLPGSNFTKLSRSMTVRSPVTSTAAASEPDLEDVKSEFRKFVGGQVTMEKDYQSGTAILSFENRAKKNAISGKMMAELNDHLTLLQSDHQGLKSLIFKSQDPDFFCSGGDLDTVKEIFSPMGGFKMATLMHDSMWKLSSCPLISVCLVRGRAIGGGAELTLPADFRVFTPDASLQFVQGRMGVATGWGGATRLVGLVGRRNCLRLLLSGQKLDAATSLDMGLCDHVTAGSRDESLDETMAWMDQLFSRITSDDVIRSMKRISLCGDRLGPDLRDSLKEERRIFSDLWGGTAHRKAMDTKIKH